MLKALSKFYNGENYQAFVHRRSELDSMAPELTHASERELEELVFKFSGYTHEKLLAYEHCLTEELKYSQIGLNNLLEISKTQGLRLTSHILLMALMAKEKYMQMSTFRGVIILRTPVDYRRKLDLSENFFGNAIVDAHVSFSKDELRYGEIFAIALKIKEAIQGINFAHIYKQASALKTLRARKGIRAIRSLNCPGTVFTNFSKMPLSSVLFDQMLPSRIIYGELYPNFVLMLGEQQARQNLIYSH